MTELPNVAPLTRNVNPVVEDGDLLLTLAGLEPGWYLVRDLYPRFLAYEDRRQNVPARSRVQLGLALGRLGVDSRYVHGHAKAWHVTPEVLARAAEIDRVARKAEADRRA